MSIQTLIKQPFESRLYSFDFSSLLAAAEELSSVISITSDITGLTFSGGATIAGGFVQQRILGGTAGVRYKITVRVNTNQSNILEGEGILQVKDI